MSLFNYDACPCCGKYHDYGEGGFVRDPALRISYFICLDCVEEKSDREILEEINLRRS